MQTNNLPSYTLIPSAPPEQPQQIIPQNQLPPLVTEWRDRDIDVAAPSWFESRKVVRVIGGFLGGLAGAAAGGTIAVAAVLTAAPVTIVLATGALASVTIGFSGASYACLSKKEFWKDPEFLKEKGKEFWEKLKGNWNYSKGVKELPKEVLELGVLDNDDFNELLRPDVYTMDYYAFVKKHGNDVLDILDEENKKALAESLLKNSAGLNTALNEPFAKLNLSKNEISGRIINLEIDRLIKGEIHYAIFKGRNEGYLENCPPDVQKEVCEKFIEYIRKIKPGMVSAQKDYFADLKLFGITENELAKLILMDEVTNMLSYSDFIIRNGLGSLKYVYKEGSENDAERLVRKALLHEIMLKAHEGRLSVSNTFKDGLKFFNVTANEVATTLLAHFKIQIVHGWITYKQFQDLNGRDFIKKIIEIDPTIKIGLKRLYLKSDYASMANDVNKEILDISNEEIAQAILQDLRQMDILAFKVMHGMFVIEDLDFVKLLLQLDPEIKQKLISLFLSSNFYYMKREDLIFQKDILGITSEMIALVVRNDANNLIYYNFKNKHGLKSLCFEDLIPEMMIMEIKQKLFKDVVAQSVDLFLEEDARFFKCTKHDVLMARWKDKSIDGIFYSVDRDHFLQNLRGNLRIWSERLDLELAGLPFEKLLGYPQDVINAGIINPNSPRIIAMVVDLYKRDPELVYDSGNKYVRFIQQHRLLPDILDVSFRNIRSEYTALQKDHSARVSMIEKNTQNQIDIAKHQRESYIFLYKGNLEKAEESCRLAKVSNEKLRKEVESARDALLESRDAPGQIEVHEKLKRELENELRILREPSAEQKEKEGKLMEQRSLLEREKQEVSSKPVTGLGGAASALWNANRTIPAKIAEIDKALKERFNKIPEVERQLNACLRRLARAEATRALYPQRQEDLRNAENRYNPVYQNQLIESAIRLVNNAKQQYESVKRDAGIIYKEKEAQLFSDKEKALVHENDSYSQGLARLKRAIMESLRGGLCD